MKALIVEVNGKSAAALCENSNIVKIANKGYRIGQQVEVVAKRRSLRRLSAIAACAAVFLGLSTTGYAAFTPYSYVTLDVNPSFEYTLNRFDRVIDVRPVNDDADIVLEDVDIPKFADLDDALELTINQLYDEGYLTGDEKDIMLLSVCGGNSNHTDTITSKISVVTTDYDVASDILEVTDEDRQAASELNTTAGKLALIKDVIGKTDKVTEADLESYVDKSVKQIIAVMDNKKPSASKTPSEVSENGNSSSPGRNPSSGKSPVSGDKPSKTPNGGGNTVVVKPDDPSEEPVKPSKPSDNDDIDDSGITGPGK